MAKEVKLSTAEQMVLGKLFSDREAIEKNIADVLMSVLESRGLPADSSYELANTYDKLIIEENESEEDKVE